MRNSKHHRLINKCMWRDEKGRDFGIDFLAMASYTIIVLFQKEVITKRFKHKSFDKTKDRIIIIQSSQADHYVFGLRNKKERYENCNAFNSAAEIEYIYSYFWYLCFDVGHIHLYIYKRYNVATQHNVFSDLHLVE